MSDGNNEVFVPNRKRDLLPCLEWALKSIFYAFRSLCLTFRKIMKIRYDDNYFCGEKIPD